MEGINEVLKMIRPYYQMMLIDLTQAYFHARISPTFQKFLFFQWNNKFYKFGVLPYGLVSGQCIFNRMTKAITYFLRKALVDILIYIDDSFLCASNAEILHHNAQLTLDIFKKCVFTINYRKLHLQPTTELEFIGFDIDTVKFEIRLTSHKRKTIEQLSRKLLRIKVVSIHELVSMCLLSQLHYTVNYITIDLSDLK